MHIFIEKAEKHAQMLQLAIIKFNSSLYCFIFAFKQKTMHYMGNMYLT